MGQPGGAEKPTSEEACPGPGRPGGHPGLDWANTSSVQSGAVERRYVLDNLARSLAILAPGAPALDREQAMRLVADLEEAERRLGQLIAELRHLADQAERG